MKGKIPVTGNIELETGEEHWSLLVRGLVNELQISGILEIEPNRRVRIRMIIREIYPPEQLRNKNTSITSSTFDSSTSHGLDRVNKKLLSFLDSQKWIMLGEIQGETTIPIIIVHYHVIKTSFYAQKTKEESSKDFFHLMGPGAPSVN